LALGKAVVTADPYPDDVDTQCIANTVMKPQDATAHALLDEILEKAVSEDGIVTVSDQPLILIQVTDT
jgi:hypothetical protein